MTIIKTLGVILVFFFLPFFVGNIYNFVLKNRKSVAIETYFRGMICLYAGLLFIQLFVAKFGWNFSKTVLIYHIYFLFAGVLGGLLFIRNLLREQRKCKKVFAEKKVWILYLLILIQGILYIGLKNPYFENNALWETARTVLETQTIYECDAFTGQTVAAGFPISNQLMFLPVLYAYISQTFNIELHVIFNFIMPVVTFLGYYSVMHLWCQKLSESDRFSYSRILGCILLLTQVGDFWTETTAFRVLHSGYMGEAIFFGGIFLYAIYELKNRRYIIPVVSVITIPGLIKYDLFFDFIKEFPKYHRQYVYAGGMLAIYMISCIYLVWKYRKMKMELLNYNLIIGIALCEMWDMICRKKKEKYQKISGAILLFCVILLSGNMTFLSYQTEFRSNVYGADKEEYELLCTLEELTDDEEVLWVQGHTEFSKWIRRVGKKTKTSIAANIEADSTLRYSFEKMDESTAVLWDALNHPANSMESDLLECVEKVPMDYIVMKRITDSLPIQDNLYFRYAFATSSYLVYQVDKR